MPSFNQFGLLAVEGVDASSFLQGQLTADAANLAVGRSTLAAHCDAKGRMVSNFVLYRKHQNHFLLQLPTSMLEIASAALSKYTVFSKVTITDLTDQLAAYTRQNSSSASSEQSSTPHSTVINIPHTALSTVWMPIAESTPRPDEPPMEPIKWRSVLIAQGVAFVTPQTSAAIIPQMLNLDFLDGISFTKGCYTGQEIIARMKYRGIVKRRTYRFSTRYLAPTQSQDMVQQEPQELSGASVVDVTNKEVGTVVNAVLDNDTINGLAVCKSGMLNSTDALFLTNTARVTITAPLAIAAPTYLAEVT